MATTTETADRWCAGTRSLCATPVNVLRIPKGLIRDEYFLCREGVAFLVHFGLYALHQGKDALHCKEIRTAKQPAVQSAGVVWQCPCGAYNQMGRYVCGTCQKQFSVKYSRLIPAGRGRSAHPSVQSREVVGSNPTAGLSLDPISTSSGVDRTRGYVGLTARSQHGASISAACIGELPRAGIKTCLDVDSLSPRAPFRTQIRPAHSLPVRQCVAKVPRSVASNLPAGGR